MFTRIVNLLVLGSSLIVLIQKFDRRDQRNEKKKQNWLLEEMKFEKLNEVFICNVNEDNNIS